MSSVTHARRGRTLRDLRLERGGVGLSDCRQLARRRHLTSRHHEHRHETRVHQPGKSVARPPRCRRFARRWRSPWVAPPSAGRRTCAATSHDSSKVLRQRSAAQMHDGAGWRLTRAAAALAASASAPCERGGGQTHAVRRRARQRATGCEARNATHAPLCLNFKVKLGESVNGRRHIHRK